MLEDLLADVVASKQMSLTVRAAKSYHLSPLFLRFERPQVGEHQKIAFIGLVAADSQDKTWSLFQTYLKKQTRQVTLLGTVMGKEESMKFALCNSLLSCLKKSVNFFRVMCYLKN
jgi:hypothetical protein